MLDNTLLTREIAVPTLSGPNMAVEIAGIKMKNPLTVGSGTYGHHGNFNQFYSVESMGALVPKTIRNYQWPGNPAPRVHEVVAGLHSSVGIPSNDWETFISKDAKILQAFNLPVIQSVIGRTEDEYVELVEKCSDLGIFAGLELNLSCPNLKQGGLDFGYDPIAAERLIKRARRVTNLPIIAKLAPDYSSLLGVAKAVEAAGADAISLVNAPRAMCIDYKTRRPIIGNQIGALSGAAIKPMAVYMVWQLYRAVKIPLFGMGGISDYRDVIEFMAAGARAVAFGTINYVNPMALPMALDDLKRYLEEENIDDINDLVGSAHD
ncbi:dihydroorotate dehydrogenase [Alcaligenaceae bacterium CGII-47]|nr:dihydroorotate dehydrogenase [Alcaligenaceae bacterium CGII-47]